LTEANVMDYSLLVGVTEPKVSDFEQGDEETSFSETKSQVKAPVEPAMRIAIVDYIGAFTLAKQLESSSKKAFKGPDVTILPPVEYAERFSNAMEAYFIGCPGK